MRFIQTEVAKLGVDINSTNVRCKRCTADQSGGFDLNYGILLCANHMRNRGHIEDTMAHEMVHAYDYMRFKVDNWNLRHQACTEVCGGFSLYIFIIHSPFGFTNCYEGRA